MKVTRRRLFLLGTTGVVGATGGCLEHITGVEAGMMIFTSYPEEVTLEISIAPEYGAESTYQETITVDQDRMPLEREGVVTGRNGDRFYVEVRNVTVEETFSEYWTLSCIGDDRVDDGLRILVTEWGEVRLNPHGC